MLLAVPMIILQADSRVTVLRSGSFVFAISSTWAPVREPTLSLLGTLDPLTMPAAFLMSSEAGGVFRMNVNDLSL